MGSVIGAQGLVSVKVNRSLWIWLNHTNTHVLQGLPGGGGQPGVFFGQSGEEVDRFFDETPVEKEGRRWTFVVQPYSGIPAWQIVIVQRSPEHTRSEECYVTSARPTSDAAHPLWVQTATPIETDATPQQAIVFLRDENAQFHARVWSEEESNLLPPDVRETVDNWRTLRQHDHLLLEPFEFVDWEIDDTVETASGDDWKALARQALRIEGRSPAKRRVSYDHYVRSRPMRNLFLKCMGTACQVSPCPFTEGATPRVKRLVAEVHHVRDWSETLDDSPDNLSVVCANHHRIFTSFRSPVKGTSVKVEGDVITISTPLGRFSIERDLSKFREELERLRESS